MLSLLVQSLYSIVDGIYVAHLSETALTATSLAFPVQMLMISLAVGTGVGANTLLSRLLGQKRHDEIGHAAVTGLLLALVSSGAFALVGAFLSWPIARLLSGGGSAAKMCHDYLAICLGFSAGNFVGIMVQRFLQASAARR
jgi:Na+-driven multidrug efflux pump